MQSKQWGTLHFYERPFFTNRLNWLVRFGGNKIRGRKLTQKKMYMILVLFQ
jgi:hypothetical protein